MVLFSVVQVGLTRGQEVKPTQSRKLTDYGQCSQQSQTILGRNKLVWSALEGIGISWHLPVVTALAHSTQPPILILVNVKKIPLTSNSLPSNLSKMQLLILYHFDRVFTDLGFSVSEKADKFSFDLRRIKKPCGFFACDATLNTRSKWYSTSLFLHTSKFEWGD